MRTDHHTLKWILSLADAMGKLAKWRPRLMKFDLKVIHGAVVKYQAADALSQLRTSGTDDTDIHDEVPVLVI